MPVKHSLATCLLCLGISCACRQQQIQKQKPDCRAEGHRRTARFLKNNRARYLEVRDRAIAFLGSLSVDPVALRREGRKGKKKLVELLDAYAALHRHATGALRRQLAERFRLVARVTERPEYHDLGAANERQLRQDSTSYLRACYLMDRMGLDTARYREQIRAVKARLDGHMARRGPHQRMAFRWYYRHFKLPLPPALKAPVKNTLVARRPNPYRMSVSRAYGLTHEVFVPFDYGGGLAATPFDAQERAYLRRALEVLTTVHIARRDVDLVGELLACLRYLGDIDLDVFRDGLRFLLSSQRENGAFGDYERLRERRGDRLELDLYLHTTSVAMDILPLAFEGPPVSP
jgi:hypothetical protein